MILVDTSIWVQWLRLTRPTKPNVGQFSHYAVCGPVIQELVQGFPDTATRLEFWHHLSAFPRVGDPISAGTFAHAANLFARARLGGYTIRSPYDCLIAAIAIENGIPVWHRDRDYDVLSKFTSLQIHIPE